MLVQFIKKFIQSSKMILKGTADRKSEQKLFKEKRI